MSKILSVHLGDDLKNRWVQFCRQSGLTPSAAIRQVIVKLTSAAAGGMKPVSTQLPDPDHARVRIELRLSTSELSAIKATAALEGVSPNQWIINLIRACLTHQPQFGMVELRALGESNSRLLAIGRNLNQIARQANLDRRLPDRLTKERIDALHQVIASHTQEVTMVMRANLDRWVLK